MNIKFIELTRNQYALVDEQDYQSVSANKWAFTSWGYAARNGPRQAGTSKQEKIYMHRLLICAPKGMEVDHINGDKIDNRRNNLRICNRDQNAKNSGLSKKNKSGHIGVVFEKQGGYERWAAFISIDNKLCRIGSFLNKQEAIEARIKAEKKHYGEYSPSSSRGNA